VHSVIVSTRKRAGRLQYDPGKQVTTIVITSEIGPLRRSDVPFDFNRAKGYGIRPVYGYPLSWLDHSWFPPGTRSNQMVEYRRSFQLSVRLPGRRTQGRTPSHIPGLPIHAAVPDNAQPRRASPDEFHADLRHYPQEREGGAFLHAVRTLTMPPTWRLAFHVVPLCNFEGGDGYGPTDPQRNIDQSLKTPAVMFRGRYFIPDTDGNRNTDATPRRSAATRNDQCKLFRKTVTLCGAIPLR